MLDLRDSRMRRSILDLWRSWRLRRRRRYAHDVVERLTVCCPESHANVRCVAERDPRTGEWVKVLSCEERGGGKEPGCGDRCIRFCNECDRLRRREYL
jgi:hypothetical protein